MIRIDPNDLEGYNLGELFLVKHFSSEMELEDAEKMVMVPSKDGNYLEATIRTSELEEFYLSFGQTEVTDVLRSNENTGLFPNPVQVNKYFTFSGDYRGLNELNVYVRSEIGEIIQTNTLESDLGYFEFESKISFPGIYSVQLIGKKFK